MSASRQILAAACREHLPQLETIWDGVFGSRCDCGAMICNMGGDPVILHHLAVSTENPRQVAYSPEGVAADDHQRRRKLTLGRYLARQHGVAITPEIEGGISKVLAVLIATYGPSLADEFAIFRGKDVTQAYVNRVGANSCMVGEDNEEITDWFSHFPDKIGLVVWQRTEGRALLWTTDDGRLVLDRIYAGHQSLARERYAAWCVDHGARPCYQALPGLDVDASGCVTLGPKAVDGRLVPYLDTWMCATKRGEFFTSFGRSQDCIYCCLATDGTAVCGGETCRHCNDRINEDDSYSCDDGYICSTCYERYYTPCECCDEHVLAEDTTQVDNQMWCDGCAREHATQCERCDDYTTVETFDIGGRTWCGDCRENHATTCECCSDNVRNADVCTVENESWCPECYSQHSHDCCDCRCYFPVDNMVEVAGERYCESCAPEPDTLPIMQNSLYSG